VERIAMVRWRVQQRRFILVRVAPDATRPHKEATSPGLCWALVMREGSPLAVVDLLIETRQEPCQLLLHNVRFIENKIGLRSWDDYGRDGVVTAHPELHLTLRWVLGLLVERFSTSRGRILHTGSRVCEHNITI
jgi:hypothetical protein